MDTVLASCLAAAKVPRHFEMGRQFGLPPITRFLDREVLMLAYCANPSCCAPLHSFAEGRLFQFEIVSISIAASDDTAAPFDEKPERQTAQFWLCGRCGSSMSLMLDPQRGLRLVPVSSNGAENADTTGLSLTDPDVQQTNSC